MFFDVKLPAAYVIRNLSFRAQKWMSWASLAALSSVPEVLQLELEESGFGKDWQNSPERVQLLNEPLFSILKELRNYETHIEFLAREKRGIDTHMRGYHFSPVNFSDLERLRNIASGKSGVSAESVDDFNVLAEKYTTQEIVCICANRLAMTIRAYVERVKVDIR